MAHPLLSLFLIVTVLGFFGFVGYIVYSIAQDVASKAAKKMEDKNIRFSKDGMKVGIREKDARDEDAQVQSLLFKAWNYSSWPAYKSRFWNKEKKVPAQQRKPSSVSGERKGSSASMLGEKKNSYQSERKGSQFHSHDTSRVATGTGIQPSSSTGYMRT
ncbi:hypothetical protein MMC34_005890 [Xylographa carneopallida]|nr:hypothetical protein [Xylographa carneopallida]